MTDWKEYAKHGDLRAVIDSSDIRGHKNRYINTLHHTILEEKIGDLNRKKVLDLGCGNGRFSQFLQDKGAVVYGVDSCKEMLDQNPIIRKYWTPVTDLSMFPDGFFDVILSVWTLQHLDLSSLITASYEIERVLKSGGRIYLIEQLAKRSHDGMNSRRYWTYQGCFGDKCDFVSYRPIMYAFDLMIDFIRVGIVPEFLFPRVAKWHLGITKEMTVPTDGYTDYFLGFEKR